jgi:hypothetical protein
MSTWKAMKLVEPNTGLMKCKVCGREHHASHRDGRYLDGSWMCRNGCTKPAGRVTMATELHLKAQDMP